jgi:protein involved in polysaccharide export with SLBB domain
MAILVTGLYVAPVLAAQQSSPIGVGDILEVSFFAGGEKQEEFTSTVGANGVISCPLLGDTKVAGLTTDEVAKQLRAVLARDFFVDPQVLVNVKEYGGQVFLTGEVRQPGAYPVKDGVTVLRACLLAGGFTNYASLRHVKLTRVINGQPKTTVVDLDKVKQGKLSDPLVLSGDHLDVPRRRF